MKQYDIVAENPESTVVAEYQTEYKRADNYQSEAELEKEFIVTLQSQGYEYLQIKSEANLIQNLRGQLEKLNDYRFSDREWAQFFKIKIANQNSGIEEKTTIIQEDFIQLLTCDNGETKNIYLIDKQNIHNNSLQVVNQYATDSGTHANRYDVTVLVNGLPLVHIELKRRGVDIKEAFNQINRYQRESFWAGSGLYEYIQLFVISNGTYTKYYSNTTRNQHIKESESKHGKTKKTSNSYEFTSWWADANNRPITDLVGFSRTFFAKHSILSLLTKYCVFTSDKMLLAMRPYQIVATERILGRINVSDNYKIYGKIEGGGYIWHTTGSGKTLTSFKTAQLASKLHCIDKVLFVVDRKDLDYQTMKEYDKFENGAANSNTSTAVLAKQLNDSNSKIIITTIQKLSVYIKKYKNDAQHQSVIRNSHFVIIFDECHRSQFGDMHTAITKAFKKYHIFGFTGTPIFAENSNAGGNPNLKTTEQAFGDKLHTYTIVDAITDKNVLPFRIDYVSTMREQENIEDAAVWDIDREKALASPERITNIVKYIREHFDQKTKRNSFYQLKERRLAGFNSVFATTSIDVCKLYYNEFQNQQKNLPEAQRLKVATIFSYGANDELTEVDGVMDENSEDTSKLSVSHRDFLENAIADYNAMFRTNYDTSSDKFQSYYKDVSQRVKNREIDLLIVVNMFLTGFDATTLNTLWVDKNLRLHGLLQAYSRTNRILNSIKTFGNIVCFRNLEKATNESIALFGDKEAGGIALLKSYKEYYEGYETEDGKKIKGYEELIAELLQKYPIGEQIIGEQEQKGFIKLYGGILKVKNILSSFDEFAGNEILSERDVQDYHSLYIDLYNEFRNKNKGSSENVNDDIVFEMELIKQVEINIDYILELIRKYHESHLQDKEIVVTIGKAIDSSVELRNKKDLIEQFIASLTPETSVDDDWRQFVSEKQKEELNRIIADENLNSEETEKFVKNAFRDGYIPEMGTAITKLLPPLNPFAPNNQYAAKKQAVIEKLKLFLDRFVGIASNAN
ncbi:MAG: type I restriction endonuclease subunit R [Prevotellaceae bacterium]|jgi:type I restriction enzyme R subunit|nr:type I restriction endonuclease subunit R [Prevotellaceae bacterium]